CPLWTPQAYRVRGLRMAHFAWTAGLLAALAAISPRQDSGIDAPGQRVALAGHSFLMPIAGSLAEIAERAGAKAHQTVVQQGLGGSRVLQHWDLPDEKDRLRKAIRAGEVEVLLLSPNVKVPDEGIDKFTALLLEHQTSGRVFVMASWFPGE